MQWLAEPGPRRPPVAPWTVTSVTQGCQVIRWPGLVRNSQATCGGTLVGTETVPNATASLLLLPAALQVMRPGGHVADPIVGLGVLDHAKRGRRDVGRVDASL